MGIEFGKGGGYEGEKSYVGMTACPVCGKDTGIVLDKRLRPTFKYSDRVPLMCDQCEKFLAAGGVFLIEVRDDTKEGDKNPFRTGYLVGLSKDWKERNEVKHQIMFMRESELKELLGDQYRKEIG